RRHAGRASDACRRAGTSLHAGQQLSWRIAVVGAGRMGAGLGGALAAAGSDVTYLVRSDRPAPPGAGLSVGSNAWGRAVESAAVVIIATPDGAVHEVASELSRVARLTGSHVVLHLSGRHDRSVLQPLEPSGAALG